MFKLNNILSLLLLLWFYDGLYGIGERENNFPLNKFLLPEKEIYDDNFRKLKNFLHR